MKNISEKDAVLALYRTTVRNMLSGDKPGVVPNASFKHASIIIEELVRCAKLRVYAFCEKLSPEVWSQPVFDQLKHALERNVDVQIVLAANPDPEPPEFLAGRIKIISLPNPSLLDGIGHFTVVDGKSLRLELDRHMRKALFAANMPSVGHELDGIFASLQKKAS